MKDERAGEASPEPTPETIDETSTHEERVIRCRACGHALTRTSARIEVDGAHAHEFVNPSAVVYRIRCFREAGGCGACGDPSTFFSWFSGYAWQLAVCASCGVHVGWSFRKATAVFFGLIAERLRDD